MLFKRENQKQSNRSVPLLNKEGLGEVLLEKPSSTYIFPKGDVNGYEADALTDYLRSRVKSVETDTFQVMNGASLGAGEQEAISLYMELSADLLII